MMNVLDKLKRKKTNPRPENHSGTFVVRNQKDHMIFQYHTLLKKLAQEKLFQGTSYDKLSVSASYKINTFILENPQDGVLAGIHKMNRSQDLPMLFGIDSNMSLRIYYTQGKLGDRSSIRIEVPKIDTYQTPVSFRNMIEGIKPTDTIIGMNARNVPALIDYSSGVTAHTLVGGATGSGKTNTMKAMSLSAMQGIDPGDAYFIFIDLEKGLSEWGVMNNCAFLACPVITRYDQAAQALAWLKIEKTRRYQRDNIANEKPIYVYVDEFPSLVFGDKDVANMFGDLHATARGAKIYFVSGTTTANKELFGDPRIKEGMTIRIIGNVNSPEDSKTMTGRAGIGAETLQSEGDFIYINKSTDRVAVPFIPDSFWDNVPRGENHLFNLKGGFKSQAQEMQPVTAPAIPIPDISAVQAVRSLDEKLLSLCIYAQNKQGKPLGQLKISQITKALKLNGGTKGYSPATVKEYMELARFIKTSGKQVREVQAYYESNKHLLK